jgi:hypothetical protein
LLKFHNDKSGILKKKIKVMKTKKLNLVQRLEVAKRNMNFWQQMEAFEMANGNNSNYQRKLIKQYATYIKNASEMHGMEFTILLL